jgi:DNA ligase-1
MRRFAELFESLDTTTSTRAKIDAMGAYFRAAAPADAAWAVYVLTGRRLKRSVGPAALRTWLIEEAGLPRWLVEETYATVGDLAETIALLVARPAGSAVSGPAAGSASPAPDVPLHDWVTERILPLTGLGPQDQRSRVVGWWRELAYRECFLVMKVLTGSLRVGVSRSLVARALAEALAVPRIHIERSLIGAWHPGPEFWAALLREEGEVHASHPYPFFLASPLEGDPRRLGERGHWVAEWKWDGIRGQLVRRSGTITLWSRGEEVITDRFPEIALAGRALPDGTVLDGEVLAGGDGEILPFARLQQRIGRQKLTPKILRDIPAHFMAYDLLEYSGTDWRPRPLRERRAQLEALLAGAAEPAFAMSPLLTEPSWDELAALREQARLRGVEGLMLKYGESAYGVGRQRGAWWKWKIDPLVFDGVLMYAAPGAGRRSNLYTDYTFGVWRDAALVPVAKAYSGLTDAEIRELDQWIRAHTQERFGTVRSVEPKQVFELAYEGIARSTRHKSGVALRFPRMLRWRRDKPTAEADTLEALLRVLEQAAAPSGAPLDRE